MLFKLKLVALTFFVQSSIPAINMPATLTIANHPAKAWRTTKVTCNEQLL